MYTKLRKINEGFTIVETLIVLAIAALIITIILIAVPDLQRSARNSNILHDAQNVASAVQTYEGNNSGGVPAGAAVAPASGACTAANVATVATGTVFTPCTDGSFTIGTNTTAEETVHVQAGDSLMWTTDTQTFAYDTTGGALSLTEIGPGQILIDYDATCNTTVHTVKTTTDTRSTAIIYPIEAVPGTLSCIQE